MILQCPWEFGRSLWLKTDTEQKERYFTGITQRQTGVMYCLACGTSESWHYDFEIAEEPNTVKALTNGT